VTLRRCALWLISVELTFDALFHAVLVPPAVDESLRHPPIGLPLVSVREVDFISVRAPSDRQPVAELMRTLDPGESEALALALAVGLALALALDVTAVLIGEAAGRAMAVSLGLRPVGVLGTLVRAKQRELIAKAGALMDRLEGEIGFFISGPLRAEILRPAGEP
jgi:predicted nucleic acid-binding protein